MDHNHIKMISQGFLASQNGLSTLYLEQNQIRELNSLQPLVKVWKLFPDFNRTQIQHIFVHVIDSVARCAGLLSAKIPIFFYGFAQVKLPVFPQNIYTSCKILENS